MDSELKGAIDVLVKRIEAKTAELNNTKKMVNDLCREAGSEPLYSEAEMASIGTGSGLSIRPDEFYTKSPMAAAREYLEKRKQAATLEEIRDALFRGGFDFDSQKWPEDVQVRNLSIGVSKNSKIFHRLPNKLIGLTAWYNIKAKKTDADDGDDNGTVDEVEVETTATDKAESFIPKITDEDIEKAKTAEQGT